MLESCVPVTRLTLAIRVMSIVLQLIVLLRLTSTDSGSYSAPIKNGEEKTVNGFGRIFGTYHEATLRSLSDALDRLNQSCEVYIHTEDRFVLNMLGTQLEKWAGNNYLNAKGEPIKHAELWEEVYERIQGKEIHTEAGRHSYSEWLDTEMKRRER